MRSAAFLILTAAALPACAQEAEREEAARLEKKAAATDRPRDRDRFLAEAWALRSRAFSLEGRSDDAIDAWRKAREYGWTGPPPAGLRKESLHPVPKPFEPRPKSTWDRFALQPFRGPRKPVGASLVHIPSMEQAIAFPAETWRIHTRFDVVVNDFQRVAEGGRSNWNTTHLRTLLEVDYALTRHIEVGARVAVGALLARGDDPLVLFENNIQIVKPGTRNFHIESFLLRGKVAFPMEIADVGAVVEFKIPIAPEEEVLTGRTFDLALSALLSKEFSKDWAVHVNVGAVFPFGEGDLFFDTDDFGVIGKTNERSALFHFGLGVTWRLHERFAVGIQLEGNTSPFSEVKVLDEAAYQILFHGRMEMDTYAFFSFAVGTGFAELSSDFTFSIAFDFTL